MALSRGIDAVTGASACPHGLEFASENARPTLEHHRARPLRPDDVAGAQLILAATTRERSAIALIDPSARARTFTVREAVGLSGLASFDAAVGVGIVEPFAAALHGRRGSLTDETLEPSGILGRLRRPTGSPLDIDDQHAGSRAAHVKMFRRLDADIEALTRALFPAEEDSSP